nr:uncharacterized protein DDB_G0292186-like [Dermatophagoides farinae]
MISLLAINNNNNLVPNSGRTKVKISYDSQDSFNTSSDTSSDPNSLCSSSSSSVDNNNMISRRRILSRSRDALNNSSTTTTSDDYTSFTQQQQQDEDVWYNKTKLISDHVDEIITKWDQIDDEIWAKVICMERNRRVAKAYARTPILTINGFNIGFDGHRIGLNGFKNPMRDRKCFEIKNQINDGIKIRMDENGNLLVKRITDADVFLIHFDKMDNMIIEKIEQRKSIQLFDMKQYHNDLLNEFRLSTPNTRLLEQKCFCFISFVSINTDELLLNTPVWCILINLVALEMLMKLLPPSSSSSINRIAEDNFYSLPITISSSSKFQNGHYHFHYNNNNNHHQSNSLLPPKLPPRDLNNKNPPLTLPEPDYEDDNNNNNNNVIMIKQQQQQQQRPLSSNLDDDPYFYGLSAHVPKFYNNNQQQQQHSNQRYPMMPRTNQPPIVRKAMIAKKLWNNQQPSSSSSSLNMNSFYPNHNDVFRSTIFDPITMIPPPPPPPSMIPAQMNNHGRGSINNNNIDNAINDNNEIYGINPSLLRKNTKFHPRTSSSPSSSSLRNIFSRKNKSSGKDQNNNPRKH